MTRVWVFGWIALLLWVVAFAQEPPLINYAAGIGEFEHDEIPPGLGEDGMTYGEGIADGFYISYSPSDAAQFFTFAIDYIEKASGVASQRISFSRTGTGSVVGTLFIDLYFPSEDYPRAGETIRISFWAKTGNWSNALLRVRARGLDDQTAYSNLISSSTPIPNWSRFEANYVVPNSNPAGIRLAFELTLQAGASEGTLWLDNLEVYGSKQWRTRPPRSLKIFTYYDPTREEANNDWIYYAREFDMIGISQRMYEARRMLVYKPELKTTTYYLGFTSDAAGDGNSIRDPFGYTYCNQYHPEWFLLNQFGQRVRFGGSLYMMDVGNPDCADRAASRIRERFRHSNMGLFSIKLDNLIDFTHTHPNQRYPTVASRLAAVVKYFLTLRRELSLYGPPLLLANVASKPYTRDWMHTYLLRQGYLDGVFIEQAFTTIYSLPAPADYISFTTWEAQLQTLAETPDKVRIYYSGYTIDPVKGRPMKLYAMASFLLGSNENAYLYLDKHYYEGTPFGRQRSWRPDADLDVPLGQPTGPYQVFFRSSDYRGGLYYRPFENGFVLVNPTGITRPYWKDGAVFTWVLDDTYYEWVTQQTYPAGTRIKLYPKQARMFIRQSGLQAPGKNGLPMPLQDWKPTLPKNGFRE
ncbi:hypothetical protein HRbin15_01743 [bacterium HR15]|nr:hypothetical protein HRbin15_01743 [bacterium HR15]